MLLHTTAFLLAATLYGQGPARLSPPTDGHRLAYTHTARTEVAFLDLGSLVREGDVVQVWGLTVLAQPAAAFGSPPADLYWTRISIDCRARMGRFVHAIAIVEGVQAFNSPVTVPATRTEGAWALDEAYACHAATPARPVVEDVEDAIRAAREIMSSDAWNP